MPTSNPSDGSENGQRNRNIHVTINHWHPPRWSPSFSPGWLHHFAQGLPRPPAASLKSRPGRIKMIEMWVAMSGLEMSLSGNVRCLWLKILFSNFGSLWSWHLVLVSSMEGDHCSIGPWWNSAGDPDSGEAVPCRRNPCGRRTQKWWVRVWT